MENLEFKALSPALQGIVMLRKTAEHSLCAGAQLVRFHVDGFPFNLLSVSSTEQAQNWARQLRAPQARVRKGSLPKEYISFNHPNLTFPIRVIQKQVILPSQASRTRSRQTRRRATASEVKG